jgi:hypothetical protein
MLLDLGGRRRSFIYFVAENRQKRRHLIHLFVAKQVILVLINLLINFFFKIKLFIGFKVLFKIFMILSKKKFPNMIDKFDSQFNVKFNFNYVFNEVRKEL